MKKIWCILLALLTLAVSPALAQTLTIDLETATIEDLTAAQTQITDRISELRAATSPAGEALTLQGTGTSIISGVEVAVAPARLTIEGKVKLTLSGKYDHTFNLSASNAYTCDVITSAETYDALVEGDGDWTITIEPLKEGGTLQASGVGPWVSDFFTLDSAAILTVSADPANMEALLSNVIFNLYQPLKYVKTYSADALTNELITSTSGVFFSDVIAKPDDPQAQCFWFVNVAPGVEWSISRK